MPILYRSSPMPLRVSAAHFRARTTRPRDMVGMRVGGVGERGWIGLVVVVVSAHEAL
jgi:hypothetical protein